MFTEKQINEILELCEKTSGKTCVSELGSRLLWTVFEKEPFCSDRIGSFIHKDYAIFYLEARTALPQLAEDYRKLLAVAEAARVACEELEGHGLYAISRLWEALTIAGYGGEE